MSLILVVKDTLELLAFDHPVLGLQNVTSNSGECKDLQQAIVESIPQKKEPLGLC